MNPLDLLLSFFNQYLYVEAKNNVNEIEYFYQTNPLTATNPLVGELINAIKTYDLDAIGSPLFKSILARANKSEAECKQILDEVIKWKSYNKEQIQPALKYLRDICASAIIKKAQRLYEESPSEYLKYLKNVNLKTSDLDTFSSVKFSEIDINTIVADSADNYISSHYDWINSTYAPYNGYPKGQMVIVCGAPGGGKSLFMMSEALHMALSKRKVLYIALGDLNMRDFVVRLGAMYSGMSFADTTLNIGAVYDSMRKLLSDGYLEVSINPAGKVGGQDIVDYVNQRAGDFEVVMIDYDSNAKGAASSDDSMYNSFGNLYEKLNEIVLAGKLVFVGSQIKVQAWDKEIVDMIDVGESSRKQHTADCIIGIGRVIDCPNHVHAIKLSKNRRGEENVISYAIRLNNARWKMIPRGVYDTLKQGREKVEYTEGQIDRMIETYNAQFNKIQQDTQRIMNGNAPRMGQQQETATNGASYKGTPFGSMSI